MSRARGIGLDVELLSPQEALRLLPAATAESLYGAVWMCGDGYLDPHTATYALADAARALGARADGTRVTGIELSPRREVDAVLHRAGGGSRRRPWSTPAGSGRRRWRRMAGAFVALDPGRSPARRPEGGRRATSFRGTCRASGIPTTSSTGRPSRAGSCSAATSRTRSRGGWTACRGSTASARCRRTSAGSSSSSWAPRGGSRSSPTRRS